MQDCKAFMPLLPYIIFSQDSGNTEKYQSVLGKAGDLCWMCV